MQNLPPETAVLLPGGRSYFLVLPEDVLAQVGIKVGTVCQFQVEHRSERSYLIFKAVTRKTSFPGVSRVHEGEIRPYLRVDRYPLTDLVLPLTEFEVHDQFVLETTVDEPVIGLSPVDFATFAVSDGELLDADEVQARREQYHQQTDSSVPEASRNDIGDQWTEREAHDKWIRTDGNGLSVRHLSCVQEETNEDSYLQPPPPFVDL